MKDWKVFLGLLVFLSHGWGWEMADLANRPDLWPNEVVTMSELKFKNGTKIEGGVSVKLLGVDPEGLIVEYEGAQHRFAVEWSHLYYVLNDSDFISKEDQLSDGKAERERLFQEASDFSLGAGEILAFEEAERAKIVDQLLSSGGWRKLGLQWGDALVEVVGRGGSRGAEWLDRVAMVNAVDALGSEEQRWKAERTQWANRGSDPLYKRFNPATLRALLMSPEVLKRLAIDQTQEDHPIGVWSVLAELQEKFPDLMHDYAALAVAFALVYDTDVPSNWPHSQVPQSRVPRLKEKPWVTLFEYFTVADRKGSLAVKLGDLAVSDLKFLVDGPIPVEEYEWARKNVRLPRGRMEEAYAMVSYNEARIARPPVQYIWPHKMDYTLKNIKEQGGICVDQAYFATVVAKAHGIPSIQISGLGSTGAHAWFGFMPGNDRWNMRGGRHASQNYVVGAGFNPQTWREVNDHELNYMSQRFTETPEYERSQMLLTLERLMRGVLDFESRQKLLEEAKTECVANPAPWFQLEALWEANGKSELLMGLYPSMIEQFLPQKDWKTRTQSRLAALLEKSGDESSAAELRSKIEAENKGRRSDLAVTMAGRETVRLLYQDRAEEAMNKYKSTIRKYGKQMGLTLFSDCVAPFFYLALHKGNHEIAAMALKQAESLVVEGGNENINQAKLRLERLKAELDQRK